MTMAAESLERWVETRVPEKTTPETLVPLGATVGEWEVLALLGKGGCAEVYRVRRANGGECAALKICVSTDTHARARFSRECEVMRIQNLPCFARLIDTGEWAGHPYLVTEELEAFELPDKELDIVRFILGVCRAVAILHAEGYVHRDLKPGNIMRRKDGTYVLIDLGMVKKLEENDAERYITGGLSVVGNKRAMIGTSGFSAPEQFTTGLATPASDIHAIGVIINVCFKGRPDGYWVNLIARATSSIPDQRFRTVSDLVSAIGSVSPVRPKCVQVGVRLFWGVTWCFAVLMVVVVIMAIADWPKVGLDIFLAACGVFLLLLCVSIGLSRRRNWARMYAVLMGFVYGGMLAIGPFVRPELFDRNGVIGGVAVSLFRVVPGVLLALPRAKRWFERSFDKCCVR